MSASDAHKLKYVAQSNGVDSRRITNNDSYRSTRKQCRNVHFFDSIDDMAEEIEVTADTMTPPPGRQSPDANIPLLGGLGAWGACATDSLLLIRYLDNP